MGFADWLSRQLDDEAQVTAVTGGAFPVRPVHLTQLEALAVLVVVLEAQVHGRGNSLHPSVARRLAADLQDQLRDLENGPPPA